MPQSRRIAELLLSIGAVRLSPESPFTWTSGIKSPIYCDARMLYGHTEARTLVVEALVQRVRVLQVAPDCIAGTATAAIGWAALVADRMKLPFVYVRSQAKGHGMGRRIEGDLRSGCDVLLIEDLLSTGGSAISSVEALRTEGDCRVGDVVAIFSYGLEAAVEKSQQNGLALQPLCTLTDLLTVAKENGDISEEQRKSIIAFAKDPERWSSSR